MAFTVGNVWVQFLNFGNVDCEAETDGRAVNKRPIRYAGEEVSKMENIDKWVSDSREYL